MPKFHFYTLMVIWFIFVAYMCYTGLAEVEEGEVNGEELLLSSTSVGRMTFGKPPAVTQVNSVHSFSQVLQLKYQLLIDKVGASIIIECIIPCCSQEVLQFLMINFNRRRRRFICQMNHISNYTK